MAREKSYRILDDILRIPAAANDNHEPPSPGAPALFWRHWMERWSMTWVCSSSTGDELKRVQSGQSWKAPSLTAIG